MGLVLNWPHSGRVVIDAFVLSAFMSARCRGEQERKTIARTDGGKTWDRVLFVDENTGCSGIREFHPKNSVHMFVGVWEASMHTWGEFSGGPGSAVYVSHALRHDVDAH